MGGVCSKVCRARPSEMGTRDAGRAFESTAWLAGAVRSMLKGACMAHSLLKTPCCPASQQELFNDNSLYILLCLAVLSEDLNLQRM